MNGSICYIQEQHPNLVETFVRAEISELHRQGVSVYVVAPRVLTEHLPLCTYAERVVAAPLDQLVATVQALKPRYLHSHFVTEAAKYTFPIAEALQIPFGFTAHAYDLWLRGARIEPEVIAELCKHPLCVTAAVEGTKHRDYLRWCAVPEEKIILTPNSVDTTTLPAPRTTIPQSVQKVVVVGRPVAKKGFFPAIDAVRLLRLSGKPVELSIIGGADSSTPLGPMLREYATHFPFVQVEGLCPNEETRERIAAADLLLVPSLVAENGDSDGIPTVITEAMLLGTPVVSTDVASITDVVVDDETGYIARPGDPASLAEKIAAYDARLRAGDSSLIEQARVRAERHTATASAATLLQHLQQVLG